MLDKPYLFVVYSGMLRMLCTHEMDTIMTDIGYGSSFLVAEVQVDLEEVVVVIVVVWVGDGDLQPDDLSTESLLQVGIQRSLLFNPYVQLD